MSNTIYATFATESDAEKAAGALMDHGVLAEYISFLAAHPPAQTEFAGGLIPTSAGPGSQATAPASTPAFSPDTNVVVTHPVQTAAPIPAIPGNTPIDTVESDRFAHIVDNARVEPHAASGISTTTGGDAAKGALEGTGIGLGLGIILGIATVVIPGLGLVAGAGALAAGLAAATGAAGGIIGGVFGYLSDMGLPPEHARALSTHLEQGGVILSVTPAGQVTETELVMLLKKYGATSSEVF